MKTEKGVYGKKRVLLYDIETSPNLGWTWGKYEQNVIEFMEEWHMLTFSYKWLGEKTTHVRSLPDYKLYRKEPKNDRELVKELWKLFDEADAIIAHNGDAFDIRKTNARFVQHGLVPPSPYKSIDTKKVAKRYFKFESNKLDDLGHNLGLGRKLDTGGFELWLGCMAGDRKSWDLMCKYNKQDVVLLEKVYLALRPWMMNHPRLDLLNDIRDNCPNCGSTHIQSRGFGINTTSKYHRLNCQDCGSWFKGKNIKIT